MKKEFVQKKFAKRRLGFSFLEISIVITIIGLIMFGIFQGGELINKAKVSVAAQMTQSSIVGKMEGLTLWLETTKLSESFGDANLENGDAITNWYDLSSKDHDFTGTATYLTNGLNGLPALSFNGSSNGFSRASSLIEDFVGANQGTVFLVQNYNSGANTSTIFWQIPGQIRINVHALHSSGTLYFDFGTCCTGASGRTTYVPSNFADRANIVTLLKSPTSASIIINGSVVTTNSSATGSFATSTAESFYVGRNSVSTFFSGEIAEVIIFERALSDNEIDDVEKYLSKKWGIAIE